MIYEERIYKIMPGRVPDIMKRFSHHAVKLFKKHDMQLVGFWSTVVGPSNHELTYILAFQDSDHRDRMQRRDRRNEHGLGCGRKVEEQ